jgi:hypothetical protein
MSDVAVQDLFASPSEEFDVCAQPKHEKQRHPAANESTGLHRRQTHGVFFGSFCPEHSSVRLIRSILPLSALDVQIVSRADPALNTDLRPGAGATQPAGPVMFESYFAESPGDSWFGSILVGLEM